MPETQTIYQIKIQGRLKAEWADWLNGMVLEISSQESELGGLPQFETTITLAVPDQAALRGVMNKLWDLNATIIALAQASPQKAGEQND